MAEKTMDPVEEDPQAEEVAAPQGEDLQDLQGADPSSACRLACATAA